jgi:hypothetical protein
LDEACFLIDGTNNVWLDMGRILLRSVREIATKGVRGAYQNLDRHETMRDYAILMCDSCDSYIIVCPGCHKPAIVPIEPLNEHFAYFCRFCKEESH